MAGNNVSHAMNKTKRRWLPNLQSVKVNEKGTHRTARVCTQCLRSKRVTRASNRRAVFSIAKAAHSGGFYF